MTPAGRSAVPALLVAYYQRMSDDDELLRLATGGIFDHVPEDKVLPYVTLGEATETPDNSHGYFGRNTLMSLHVWSAYRGFAESAAIGDRLIQLFDHQDLAVVGHHVVAVRFETNEPLRDPDPNVRHQILRFRNLTEQET